jgi:hypothetical protein
MSFTATQSQIKKIITINLLNRNMEIIHFWDVMLHSLVHFKMFRRYALPPSSGYKSRLGKDEVVYRYRGEEEEKDWGPKQTNKSKENGKKNTRLLRGLFYLKIEVTCSSETSVKIYHSTQYHIHKNSNIDSHCRENLK